MARMTFAQQRQRTRELDDLRLKRPLTPAERLEADELAGKLYNRIYRLAS